jgi:REP element-mobilizing transposase RayT
MHGVLRTYKSRETLPTDERREFLYRYTWGFIKNKGGDLYRMNSVSDHAHLLFTFPPTIALSDFMRELKAQTSKVVKSAAGFERFHAWSEGYAALSYSFRDKEMLIEYIKNQQEHHKKVTFADEYRKFIEAMGLTFDERDWDR